MPERTPGGVRRWPSINQHPILARHHASRPSNVSAYDITSLPKIEPHKKRSSVPILSAPTRRTSYKTTRKGRRSYSERSLEMAANRQHLYGPETRSGDESRTLTRRSSFLVAMCVDKARRKFSIGAERSKPRKKLSFSDYVRVAVSKKSDGDKRKLLQALKLKALNQKKRLLDKFRLAVKLTIFCARTFKEHCLRINESKDELAPYIKRLHFQDDDENSDLLIDLSKFKANRQLRIPDEAKRILSMEVGERSEQELYTVTIALRNIKAYSEFPKRMQKKIAEVGLYEKYESKRVIVRQDHPASGFYFILSGAVVVMVMDRESNYARPVAHLYKGQTFGELAIINGTQRNSTVIAKETCEFLSISSQDYHKIFMAGGVKNINDPDQEVFLKSLSCLSDWPIQIFQDHPTKCQFLFFKNSDVIVQDSHYSDWLIIVKSGSVQVLKKLKKVEAFEWKKTHTPERVEGRAKREILLKKRKWRRFLPELNVPLQCDNSDDDEDVSMLDNGRPIPFRHPDEVDPDSEPSTPNTDRQSRRRGNRLHRRCDSPDEHSDQEDTPSGDQTDGSRNRSNNNPGLQPSGAKSRYRSDSVIKEEDQELLGYQPHIRTIMEDIDAGIKRKDDESSPADTNPEFVHVQTLTKGQVFGLADVILKDQPGFSVVSRGADCLLINKQFYLEHASEKLLREMRQELCPYPTEAELQQKLQVSVDWQEYKKVTLSQSMANVALRKHMRTTTYGTKVQEAY